MRIIKHLKKNNGSTLTLVLFMLFMLSVTAIAVITLTGSELSMSVMGSDRSKALQVAQAGAEKAAQILDTEVAQAQEDARVLSSQIIQGWIDHYTEVTPVDGRNKPSYSIPYDSPFYKVIDNYSKPGEIIILNEGELNAIFDNEYKYQFNKLINKWFKEQTYLSKPYNLNATEIDPGNPSDGKFSYEGIDKKSKDIVITSIVDINTPGVAKVYSPISNDESVATTSIVLTSTGEYKSPSNGSTYKRSIKAEFGLLTKSEKGTTQIPITYGKLTKVRFNKDEKKPSLLYEKALIAQRNIISVDGLVKVKGDTVCFGTMPTKVIGYGSNAKTVIDYDADGYKFGGIMAGMVSSNSEVPKVWEDINFRGGESSFKDTLTENSNALLHALGIVDDYDINTYFNKDHSGSFSFDGNVYTLAYLHSLYNMDEKPKANIAVSGDTFARSVKVESESNFSTIELNNVYFYDDLRIDGNKSKVKIGGWDNNIINPNPAGKEGTLVGLNKGGIGDPVSSSVIVAGDSNLYIHGSVYVGGSTSYVDYAGYISGMSIQKSDSRPAKAFLMDGNPKNPQNIFYLYNNSDKPFYSFVKEPGEPVDPKDQNDPSKLILKDYIKPDKTTKKMMEGSGIPDPSDPENVSKYKHKKEPFDIRDKAMHLKFIWNEFWQKDIGYASYFNNGDIVIKPEIETKIKGFCYGGVAANNTIYDPYKGFINSKEKADGTQGDYNVIVDGYFDDNLIFHPGLNADYVKAMDLFIDDKDELNEPIPPKNISGSPNASNDSVNKETLTVNKLYPDNYKTGSNSFMYYSNDNVVLTNNSVNGNTLKEDDTNYLYGIVYSDKDIYVKSGTNIKGILIAEGNIVFLGDADIVYDSSVVDILLCEEPLIGRFFKHSASDLIMNDPKAIVQTIKKADVKNIKIISWKEV